MLPSLRSGVRFTLKKGKQRKSNTFSQVGMGTVAWKYMYISKMIIITKDK